MQSSNDILLSLIRLGIRHHADYADFIRSSINWQNIKNLADKHGVLAVVVDGIEYIPSNQRPSQDLLLEWIGEVLHNYEFRYKAYQQVIAEMAGFYNSHGYKMMILKGYSCSLNWPKPEHRPCGDIDIWQFGRQKEADRALGVWFKEHGSRFEIDNSHHHHTVFNWGEFTVENHYDFVNVHAERSSARIENIFKELGRDDTHTMMVEGEQVYLPSPNLHALFLLRHMVSHFAASEINLRQVLDWAFFVEKHTKEIDWEWLLGVLKEYHMLDFYNIINAICVGNLGFDVSIFKEIQYNPDLKDRVLHDILEPKFSSSEPRRLFKRMYYKYRRWQGNAWKQKLCYNESRYEMFWTGLVAKIMKPMSF